MNPFSKLTNGKKLCKFVELTIVTPHVCDIYIDSWIY